MVEGLISSARALFVATCSEEHQASCERSHLVDSRPCELAQECELSQQLLHFAWPKSKVDSMLLALSHEVVDEAKTHDAVACTVIFYI